jgi:hypothetical protein
MKQSKTDKFILDYCKSKGFHLFIDPELGVNDGFSYPATREIHLARKYSSYKIKLAVFIHEVGHCVVDGARKSPYNIFECEMAAWAEGMKLYRRLFGKSFSKTQAEFMLKCLKSYCRS